MLEIRKFLTLSTGHVTAETATKLDLYPAAWGIYGGPLEAGWFIWAPEHDIEGAPEDLMRVLRFARAHDCPYVLFDRDGDVIPDLPTWEW